MQLSATEMRDWVSTYINAQQSEAEIGPGHPMWWAIERFRVSTELSDAEDAWSALLEVLARQPSQQVLVLLASGPLEDLIDRRGAEFIDRIEAEASTNAAFKQLLDEVWECGSDDVWERVEASRRASPKLRPQIVNGNRQ